MHATYSKKAIIFHSHSYLNEKFNQFTNYQMERKINKQTIPRPLPRSKSAVLSAKKTNLDPVEESSSLSTLALNQCDESVRRSRNCHSTSSFNTFKEQSELTVNGSGSSRYFLRRRSTACIQTENVAKKMQIKRHSMHNLTVNNLEKTSKNNQPLSNTDNSVSTHSLSENLPPLSLPKQERRRLKNDYKNYSLYPNLAIHAQDFIKLAILAPTENLFSRKDIAATFQRSIPRDEFIRKFKEDQKRELADESKELSQDFGTLSL